MTVYKAPESTSKRTEEISVFLAGSIEMGQAEKWQDTLPKLVNIKNVAYFNPRRDDWDSSWIQSIHDSNFNEQVTWELDHLEESDIIFLYFAPDTKSPISLLELGLFATEGKVICVCPDGFWRKGNIEIVCERYGIPLFNTLKAGISRLQEEIQGLL